MARLPSRALIGVFAAAAVAALYLSALSWSPVYLLNDEVFGALQSISLAQTGRSLSGERWPVFFRGLEFPPGRDPLFIYVTAAAFKLWGVGEVTLRVPTVLVGLACCVLAYALGARLWRRADFALMAALVLALTPAHFINSRIAIPTSWSTPWILGWLLGLVVYIERRDRRWLAAAMLSLGVSVFGYLGSALVVPLYVAITIIVLVFGVRERTLRPYAIAAGSFALPLLLLAYWQLLHPERWRELASYYVKDVSDVKTITPLLTGSWLPNFAAVQERVTAYWNHFDPALLFLGGDRSPRYSTDRSGVFLLPAAILLPLGMYQAARASLAGRLLVAVFVVTPIVAALGGDVQIQRVLPFVSVGALLVAWGLVSLVQHPRARLRTAAVVLAAAGVLQFAVFAADYFGHYRLRSGESRGGNLRGAILEVMQSVRTAPAAVYLSATIPNVHVYWRFYAAAAGQPSLPAEVVAPSEVPTLAGTGPALLIADIDDMPKLGAIPPGWRLRADIVELDGPVFYRIYARDGAEDASH
jgi:4-amino-4-deoxy-L-arabinose transferase-like glycosyltransferase